MTPAKFRAALLALPEDAAQLEAAWSKTIQGVDQEPNGCVAACLATITGVPLAAFPRVPDRALTSQEETDITNATTTVLVEHGWHRYSVWTRPRGAVPRGWAVAGGRGPRGMSHSVVVYDGRLVWDPHTSRAGLLSVDEYEILVPLMPDSALPTLRVERQREAAAVEAMLRWLRINDMLTDSRCDRARAAYLAARGSPALPVSEPTLDDMVRTGQLVREVVCVHRGLSIDGLQALQAEKGASNVCIAPNGDIEEVRYRKPTMLELDAYLAARREEK